MSQNNRKIIQAFTKLAPKYEQVVETELQHFWGWSYEGFVDRLFADLPPRPGDIVLDVATGTGVIPARLARDGRAAEPLFGLDITMAMLERACLRFNHAGLVDQVSLTCASATEMPFARESFTLVICCLATHHMSVEGLVAESLRILRQGGRLSIADAGRAQYWDIPGATALVKLLAFVYFFFREGYKRARAELAAVSNVHSADEWRSLLDLGGFKNISIVELKSRYAWIPSPLIIACEKI